MPDSLVTSIRIDLDESVRPPGTPLSGTWLSRYAQKNGYRWKIGEDKTQILTYNGTIWRQSLVKTGSPVGTLNGYYVPIGASSDHAYSGNAWTNSPPAYGAKAYNKAYDRFKEVALGENATWGTTVAEGREALGLIGGRAKQLFTSYRYLRKGQFDKFLKELDIKKPMRKHKRYLLRHRKKRKSVLREVSRNSSALWLEYWFGWAPIAGEIYQSTVALTTHQTGGYHWATATEKLPDVTGGYLHSAGSGKQVTERGKYMVKTGAYVIYSNPNVALAQQMGLANPLAIAWELVPFSFVIDWFTNIGDCLGALSDLYGVTLQHPYTSEYLRTTSEFRTTWRHTVPSTWWEYQQKTHRSRRKKGLISPVFIRPRLANFGQSLTRAATAVSLLVQLFIKR